MTIYLRNNTSVLVIGGTDHIIDPSLISNIRDYLSVDVPGAFHSPQFQKRVWDGKKYYCTPGGKVPTGMIPVLLSFIEDEYQDLEVEIVDERGPQVAFSEVFSPGVGDYEMAGDYEYQRKLIAAFDNYITFRGQKIYFPRGIVDAATNAGKTTIIAGIYTNVLNSDKKMLILIHRKAIYKQLVDFMGEIFGDVGQVNDKYYEIKQVTVAMVQSLSNRLQDSVTARHDIASFNILVVDESHRAGSKTYKSILKHSTAYLRAFMSGTALDSADIVSKLDQISFSGPKLAEVSKTELMGKGISTPVEVRVHLCNTLLFSPVVDYRDVIENCVHYSSERASVMKRIIDSATGPVLIAVDKIEHGKYIHEWLVGVYSTEKNGIVVEFTHGQDPKQLEKIDAFKKGEFPVLISTGILSEGVNIPRVQEIIYAPGGKAKVGVKQWMGRAERLFQGKEKAVFHDFWDVGRYIQKHSAARMKIYGDENLPVMTTFAMKDAKKLKTIVV